MYVFDNAAPQAATRLGALAESFDEATRFFLSARGVRAGWHCLEVGGGAGSIAAWLAERVSPGGRVLVTDIDPRHIALHGVDCGKVDVDVRRHDILNDPLPAATFDLAHARLVLSHLADPDLAVARIVEALKPGGWLVVEDFEVQDSTLPEDTLSATARAMRAITSAAADQRLGRTLGRRLAAAGLQDVDTEGRTRILRGAVGARLLHANFEQLRARMLADALVSAAQFECDLAALDEPTFEMRTPTMWTAWGRRPE